MRLKAWIFPAAIAVIVFACFAPALNGEFLNWDDAMNFTANQRYRGLSRANLAWMFTEKGGHYIPLTWLTFGLDFILWGMNPHGYHLTSLLLHAANAILLYLALLELLRFAFRIEVGPPRTVGRWAATAGALAFAIHPLRVESVAWITERRDVLAGFFFLLSLLAYLRMATDSRRRGIWRAAALLFFVCSLLSKAIGVALPLVLLLLDAVVLGRFSADNRQGWRTVLAEKIPFFILTVAGAVMAVVANSGALISTAELPAGWNLVQPGFRISFYLGKIFLPLGLCPQYVHPEGAGAFLPEYCMGAGVAIAVSVLLVCKRKRWPAGLATWTAFVVLLAPSLGIPQVAEHIAADRHTYLPALPLSMLAAAGCYKLWSARSASVGLFRLTAAGAGLALLLLGTSAFRYTKVWTNSLSLWNEALRVNPRLFFAHTNRGIARRERGDLDGAIEDFSQALRLRPGSADAHNKRGAVYLSRQELPVALADFDAALTGNPRSFEAYSNRGSVRLLQKDFDGALADLTNALHFGGPLVGVYFNRATVYLARGDLDRAASDARAASALDPRSPETRQLLAQIQALMKRRP